MNPIVGNIPIFNRVNAPHNYHNASNLKPLGNTLMNNFIKNPQKETLYSNQIPKNLLSPTN
jgi:hypothetical protein